MQFSTETNNQDLVSEVRFWTKVASTTDHTIAEITRSINLWLDTVASWIMQADTRWEFDDNNQTNLPSATATLVDSQRDYAITAATYLKIKKVQIKDSAGNYQELDYVAFDDIEAKNLREGNETAGMPRKYTTRGNSIFLYPKPSSSNVTLVAGLRLFFQRNVVYFIPTDTTATPGFAQPFHRILAWGAAYDYLKKEGSPRANDLWQMILAMKADLIEFYGSRQKDEQPHIRLRSEDYNELLLSDESGGTHSIIIIP